MRVNTCRPLFLTATILSLLLSVAPRTEAQSAQTGADARARVKQKIAIDYVHYRPARWEQEKFQEFENEHLNQGGLIYLYFRNTVDEPVDLRFWRVNGKDASYWRLNYFIAYDRNYKQRLAPGEMGVLEINATSPDFGEGSDFSFAWVEGGLAPVARIDTQLREDPVAISCIRVLPGMRELEVHVRHVGQRHVRFEDFFLPGIAIDSIEWVGREHQGPGHGIARVTLSEPLSPGHMLIARLDIMDNDERRVLFTHRRAFEDFFPIGVWSNNENTYATLRAMHIDTVVRGGRKTDPFFTDIWDRYGFRTMVHTQLPVDVDTVRDLQSHPAVACWMVQDEPDWSIPPATMVFAEDTIRRYDTLVPTMITLCRNIKFFEYAPIADIPVMDHYAVTAPSSSRWPKMYGTYLEETAWYTRDLKIPSEPKPIWIWTQGIANWGQLPQRPVPTPEELAAQLVLNLAYGAKGILWFNYDEKIAEKYPDAPGEMKRWGRVLQLLRHEFQASEPVGIVEKAPEKMDASALVNWNNVLLCLTNLDYEIHPQAYPFETRKQVEIVLDMPEWIAPATALNVTPDGIEPVPLRADGNKATIALESLKVCAILIISGDDTLQQRLEDQYAIVLQQEHETL